MFEQFSPRHPEMPVPSVTWIPLSARTSGDARAPATPRVAPHAVGPIQVSLPALPELPSHAPQDDLAPFQDFALCGPVHQQPVWQEDRERCEKWRRHMAQDVDAPSGPNPRDMRLAKQFDREKARQDAPILLPCFGPDGSVSIMCLFAGITDGFTPGSYADRHSIDRYGYFR